MTLERLSQMTTARQLVNERSFQQVRVVRYRDLGVEALLSQTWTHHAERLSVVLVHVFHRHFQFILRQVLPVFEGGVTQNPDGMREQTLGVCPAFHTHSTAIAVDDFIHR